MNWGNRIVVAFVCFAAFIGYMVVRAFQEDFDLVKRARNLGFKHCLIQKDALVSARKYQYNGWLRVNLVNLWVFLLFQLGVSTERLCGMYKRMLRME